MKNCTRIFAIKKMNFMSCIYDKVPEVEEDLAAMRHKRSLMKIYSKKLKEMDDNITTADLLHVMCTDIMNDISKEYGRTSLFRTRLIRSPRYFEGRSNALGFTLPLYASPVISKPRYFELFFISLGTSK